MKVTGYQLREALKLWDLRKTAAQAEFKDSQYKFSYEEKEGPISVAGRIDAAERAIVKLQVAQMQYNVQVRVTLPGNETVSLAEAVKLSGVASRLEALWKGTTVTPQRSFYDTSALERDPTRERAMAMITPKEILDETTRASRAAGQIRAALAAANATELAIENLSPLLFE